jgi:hypothetical protein
MTSRRFAVVEVEHSIKPPTLVNRMATSRSQLDRVLDPSSVSVQLDTLIKAARALGSYEPGGRGFKSCRARQYSMGYELQVRSFRKYSVNP